MNNPIDHKRLTSLDIKIAAAKRRAAAERATVAPNPQPTEGLTSLRSTKEKDVPMVRAAGVPPRVQAAIDQGDQSVASAMARIAAELVAEPGYLSAWTAKLAEVFYMVWLSHCRSQGYEPTEESCRGFMTDVTQKAAAGFLHWCFGVTVSTHATPVTPAALVKIHDPSNWYSNLLKEDMAARQKAQASAGHAQLPAQDKPRWLRVEDMSAGSARMAVKQQEAAQPFDNFSHAAHLWMDATKGVEATLEAQQPRTITVDVRQENTGRSLGDRLTSK